MKPKILIQIFVLLTVPFNTARAVQIVQAKLSAPSQDVALLALDEPNVPIIFIDSDGNKIAHAAGTLSSNSPIAPIKFEHIKMIAEPKLAFQGPANLVVPILLYHRVDVSLTNSQYYISPDKFEEHMKLLKDWGYTTITTELLVKAIAGGADLPLHPLLITFDDGNSDNYTTAFPIMQKYGFSGVLYIIGKYMGTPGYMNADQIKEMAKAGWEVGSHSMTHPDLTSLDRQQQIYEIIESRNFLETKLGVPILTFAYPIGASNRAVINLVYSTEYIAGMGLGSAYDQGTSNLFTLQRRGIDGRQDLNSFASLLPWQGDSVYLPADMSASTSP